MRMLLPLHPVMAALTPSSYHPITLSPSHPLTAPCLRLQGRVLRFAFVANLASSCRTNEEVLSFLEKHGLLVQGCWALRRYGAAWLGVGGTADTEHHALTPIPLSCRDPHHSPSHAALRVIILSAFRAHRKLDRLAIEEQVKAVPSLKRLVRPILEELAVLRRWERSWELKQPWEPEFEQACVARPLGAALLPTLAFTPLPPPRSALSGTATSLLASRRPGRWSWPRPSTTSKRSTASACPWSQTRTRRAAAR